MLVERNENLRGVLAGFSACAMWGALALYWKLLDGVPALEILAYRVLFSLLALSPLLFMPEARRKIIHVFIDKHLLWRMLTSSVLIGANWYVYIWAVNSGRILDTSLGYFINPLMNVTLGFLFLRERPSHLQWLAIAIACCGVGWSLVMHASFPWVAFCVAGTFAAYGFVRKTAPVEALPGLFIETLLLAPIAAFWLFYPLAQGLGLRTMPTQTEWWILIASGVITTIPLVMFGYAARHIRLMTLGLVQYISPTGSFLIGVYIYHEPMPLSSLITFGCIWVSLLLYTYDSWRQIQITRKQLACCHTQAQQNEHI